MGQFILDKMQLRVFKSKVYDEAQFTHIFL